MILWPCYPCMVLALVVFNLSHQNYRAVLGNVIGYGIVYVVYQALKALRIRL